MGIIQWFKMRSWSREDFIRFLDEEISKENKTERELLEYIQIFIQFVSKFLPKLEYFDLMFQRKNIPGYDLTQEYGNFASDYNLFGALLPRYVQHIIIELDKLRKAEGSEKSAEKKLLKIDQRYTFLRNLIKDKGHEAKTLLHFEDHLAQNEYGIMAYKRRIKKAYKEQEGPGSKKSADEEFQKLRKKLRILLKISEDLKQTISQFYQHDSHERFK